MIAYGKTKEEINELKQKYETLGNKLKELSDDELNAVTGGMEISAFFGLFVPTFSANLQQKSVANPEDEQMVGGNLPPVKEDEKYVM